jgi:AcrR family transcriptional regulator
MRCSTWCRGVPVAPGETIDVERTRAKLLRAGTELFYRDGVAVSVDDIARRAATSKLTVYRHFGDKDGLLEAVLRQRSDRVMAWLSAAADLPADPLDQLVAVFDALGGWYAEHQFRGCALVNAATQERSQGGPARRIAGDHLVRLRALLTGLAAQAGAQDAELAGRQLLILLEGATVVAAITRDRRAATDARALVAGVVDSAD